MNPPLNFFIVSSEGFIVNNKYIDVIKHNVNGINISIYIHIKFFSLSSSFFSSNLPYYSSSIK